MALWTEAVATARWCRGQPAPSATQGPQVLQAVSHPVVGSACWSRSARPPLGGWTRQGRSRGRCAARDAPGRCAAGSQVLVRDAQVRCAAARPVPRGGPQVRSAAARQGPARGGRQVRWSGRRQEQAGVPGRSGAWAVRVVLAAPVLATPRRRYDGCQNRSQGAAGTRSAALPVRRAGRAPHGAYAGWACQAPWVHQTRAGRRPAADGGPQARSSDLTSSVQLVLGDVLNHTVRYQIPHRKPRTGAFSHICG